MGDPVNAGQPMPSMSSLETWSALCKDCRNLELSQVTQGKPKKPKQQRADLRQEEFEYSDAHASRQRERGQSRSDRCPECRKRHKREIAAFPVAYVDIKAIGEAAKYVVDSEIGPTGPLGGLGPLPLSHGRRTESVDLRSFALGLTDQDIVTLLEKMSANQVVVLEAGTGTGKSTLAPFRLMNPPAGAPYRPTDIGPIIVTEPRVPATTEVAKFVGEAMCFGHDPETCTSHIGPGYPVGYQCEGRKVWDEACSLIYVTDGTMVNWILNGDLARIGTVIIDEAHERSENIDLILTLLATQLPRFPHLRVVIASATIDKTYFMKFFEQTPTVSVGHHHVEAAKSIGYGVPLFSDIEFTEEILEHGFGAQDPKNPTQEPRFRLPGWPDKPNQEEDGANLRALTRDRLLGLRAPATAWPQNVDQAAVNQTLKILEATSYGDVLVFLPSQKMVDNARNMLQIKLEDLDWGDCIDVYWLMRATDKAEKERALAQCPPGRRKVVVASNLAETSLTIAGIRYVVDSGLVIQAKWDASLAVSYAPLVPHSQSGVRQRWGRVGRKTHGWVFPLYSLAHYLEMPRDTPAGSTQTNLEGTVLKILAAGEDPSNLVFPADFVAEGVTRDSFAQESADGFSRERDRALSALQRNGAVTGDGRRLTRLGSELVRSRLPPEQAIALMFADRLACVPEVATALIALGGGKDEKRDKGRLAGPEKMLAADPHWPIEWNIQARRCHEALAIGCKDDLDLVIRVFSSWSDAQDPSRWCAQWWINEDALRAISRDALKLIESMAPGMSKEASRALDPRLTVRARAVFSRSLSSLHFTRISAEAWRSTNPNQQDPVGVSPLHLVAPPSDFIALVRERPRGFGRVSEHGEALGLIAVLDWATQGDPSDFELMRRVREHTQKDDLAPQDPAAHVRATYPIGALIRVMPGASDATGQRYIVKLSDGLAKPTTLTDFSTLASSPTDDDPIVYSTESADPGVADPLVIEEPEGLEEDLSLGEDRGGVPTAIAGAEVPEEEVRLTPIPIQDLENPDLEEFDEEELLRRRVGERSAEGVANPDLIVATNDLSVSEIDPWFAVAVGYEATTSGIQLVVEPTTEGHSMSRRRLGERLVVKAGEIVRTHFASVRVVRHCDRDGRAEIGGTYFVTSSLIDESVGSDAEAIAEGSIWSARMIAGHGKHEYRRVSLAENAIDHLTKDQGAMRAAPGTLASCTALLTGERFVDWQSREHWIARLEISVVDYSPSISVSALTLNKAGLLPTGGMRIKLDLRYNFFARRSGTWLEEDVEQLSERHPKSFGKGKKPTQILLVESQPLSEQSLDTLLGVEPGNAIYERNSWLLWTTSRQLGVRSASAIGEAEVSRQTARSLRADADVSDLRKKYGVGITITDAGRVLVSGVASQVGLVLDEIEAIATTASPVVQLPARPDGRYPKFPPKNDVIASTEILGRVMVEQVKKNYDPRTGILALSRSGSTEMEQVLGAVSQAFGYCSIQLTFPDERGFFAFKNQARWLELTADAPDLDRWVVDEKKTWAVFARDDASCARLVDRVRAVLPKVSFRTSDLIKHVPRMGLPDSPKSDFAVTYVTPSEPDTEVDVDGPAGRTSGPDNVRVEERVIDLRDDCTIIRIAEDQLVIRDPDGRSITVNIEDYRRDSRPLHWLREYGAGS